MSSEPEKTDAAQTDFCKVGSSWKLTESGYRTVFECACGQTAEWQLAEWVRRSADFSQAYARAIMSPQRRDQVRVYLEEVRSRVLRSNDRESRENFDRARRVAVCVMGVRSSRIISPDPVLTLRAERQRLAVELEARVHYELHQAISLKDRREGYLVSSNIEYDRDKPIVQRIEWINRAISQLEPSKALSLKAML